MLDSYIKNDNIRKLYPDWYSNIELCIFDLLQKPQPTEFPKKHIGWQETPVLYTDAKFVGQIIEISDDRVNILFSNPNDSSVKESYYFKRSLFKFNINLYDFVLLNQYSDMCFEFIEYKHTDSEIESAKLLVQQIQSYEENYDI